LRQAPDAGQDDLFFLDESGFAPTIPTGYTGSRIGQRVVIPREDTQNRRVNALGAHIVGTAPDLVWQHTSEPSTTAVRTRRPLALISASQRIPPSGRQMRARRTAER
jgi:hypothetical protein